MAVLAAVLVGCGGGDRPRAAAPDATPARPTAVPPKLQSADCAQWRELRAPARGALIEQMTLFFGARVDDRHGRGQTLSPARATAVLTAGCRPPYATRIKLYKLYGRAAAFTPAG